MSEPRTVRDFIDALSEFPDDMEVMIRFPSNGNTTITRRDVRGKPVVAIYKDNGGSFGEKPLTEEEYSEQSRIFMDMFNDPNYRYTTIHGDHRFYRPLGLASDTNYGYHFDKRIVRRMVKEGKINAEDVADF